MDNLTYFPILIFICSISLVFLNYYSSNKYIIFLSNALMVLIVSSLISFRELDGADTLTYIQYFYTYSDFSTIYNSYFSWKGDYFFFFIGWLIKQFTNDATIYIYITSLFSISILFYSINRLYNDRNNKSIFPILIFVMLSTSSFVFLYANVIRQGMAFSLIVLSLSFLIKKENLKGFFILILALFTHKSAIIFFVIFILIFRIKIKFKMIYFLLIMSLILGKIGIPMILAKLNVPFITDKILAYKDAVQSNIDLKILINFLNIIFISLLKIRDKVFLNIFKTYLLIFFFALLFYPLGKFSSRLLLYNGILLPILYYGLILIYNKNTYIKLPLLVLFAFLYAIFVFNNKSILYTLHYSIF